MVDDGYWRIVGRQSVDIIKTGGYKVSALEIEEALRGHSAVTDAAVVGVADEEWGERVCALVVAAPDSQLEGESLRSWCKERLAPYKVPKHVCLVAVAELPRNAMGKVLKPRVREMLLGAEGNA